MTEPTRVTDLPEMWGSAKHPIDEYDGGWIDSRKASADELAAALKADPVVRVAELIRRTPNDIGPSPWHEVCKFDMCLYFRTEAKGLMTEHQADCPVGAATGTEASDD